MRARALSRTVVATGLALATATTIAATTSASAEDASGRGGVRYYDRPVAPLLPQRGLEPVRPVGPADYTFLSAPDFMNADVADVSGLPTWHRGLPNSWNSSYAQMVDTVLDTFQAEGPDDVFVAGDLVEGHWGEDADRTGIFGPARTNAQRKAALKRTASFYFSQWRQRFEARGLPVLAALGDHDIGDNPWAGGRHAADNRFKLHQVQTFKRAFFEKVMAAARLGNRPPGPAHGTAFATYVAPEVLLVTVDVFRSTRRDVVTELDPQQLRWLGRVLAAANRRGTDWIIVQGHTPVITPVRTYGSSAMSYTGGTRSAFWKVMVKNRVDLYLNGEVHDISVRRADGITQVSHGGTLQMATPNGRGATNYALGQIYGDRLWLRDNRFAPRMVDTSAELWQVGRTHRPVVRKEIWDEPPAQGHLVLTSDNQLLYSDGAFIPYAG
ncbi:metallophosphoesterase family protein [Nocardioides aquiterrae]